jgi:hypothetical protein
MLLAVFWFLTSIAYVAIGVFNYSKAKSLSTMDIPTLEKYLVPPPEEPDLSEPPLHVEGGQKPETTWDNFLFDVERYADVLRNLNNAFDSIKTVASEFNKSTKLNRGVLRVAAISFFLAAIISFVQGVLSVLS